MQKRRRKSITGRQNGAARRAFFYFPAVRLKVFVRFGKALGLPREDWIQKEKGICINCRRECGFICRKKGVCMGRAKFGK